MRDIECKEVIISTLARRGQGVEGDPVRRVLQVWDKSGELIAEKDEHLDSLAKIQKNLNWLESVKNIGSGVPEFGQTAISSWVAFDWNKIETHPIASDKYLICRKDGKIHWETWNGSGWAYNHKEIRFWAVIVPPSS